MNNDTLNQLKLKAKEASKNSYSPYSNFPVGSAMLFDNGQIYTGVNVENASYGLTMCAERNAIFSAVTQGAGKIEAIVIYTPTETPTPPCGACRQVISEFSAGAELVSICDSEKELVIKADELLPYSFSL